MNKHGKRSLAQHISSLIPAELELPFDMGRSRTWVVVVFGLLAVLAAILTVRSAS